MKAKRSSSPHPIRSIILFMKPSYVSCVLVFVCAFLWVKNEAEHKHLVELEDQWTKLQGRCRQEMSSKERQGTRPKVSGNRFKICFFSSNTWISPVKPMVKGNTPVLIEVRAPGKLHSLREVITYIYIRRYAIGGQLFVGKRSKVNHHDGDFQSKSNNFCYNRKKVAIGFIRALKHFVGNRSCVTVIILPLLQIFPPCKYPDKMILETLRFFSSRVIIVQSQTQGELKAVIDPSHCSLTTAVTAGN